MRGLGRLLVFACCFLVGALLAWKKHSALQCRGECLRLMRHAEEKIRRSLCPRSQLFCDFTSPVLSRCGFLDGLQRGEDPEKLCRTYAEELGLEQKSKECLCRFFSSLGKMGYQQQLRFCQSCCEEWEALLKEDAQRDKNVVGLYLTLGAAVGGFIVILLL